MSVHLHLDLVGGIAGDMTVAALLDAGVPLTALRERLAASGLPPAELHAPRDERGSLVGTRFVVAPERDPPHRHWSEIRALIAAARLSDRARERALAIFGALARAEAKVHGCDVDDVHFHEVGALDSIVDIVAAAIALELLGATSFSCSAVPLCSGTVATAHGQLPIPGPATAELLLGFPCIAVPGAVETVTPTGAAILATLVPGGAAIRPPVRLTAVGTGLGTHELPDRPNVLRVLVGEALTARAARDGAGAGGAAPTEAVVVEASIDDMDPRLYGAVVERLFAAGALDVTLTPTYMKKQRPGTVLGVLAPPELEGVVSGVLLRETTTLGVRSHDVRRTVLDRRIEPVATAFGVVPVKLGLLGDECINVSPEYDACERIARERDVPVKDVLAAACAAAAERLSGAPAAGREDER